MSTPYPPENPSGRPPWGWQPPAAPSPAYPGHPGYPGYLDPQAPFGRDPATGLPLSDKSAAAAGLLQLFLGLFGAGRFYIGSTQIAVAQLGGGRFWLIFGLFCLFGLAGLLRGL